MYRARPLPTRFPFRFNKSIPLYNGKWRMSLWFLKTSKSSEEHQHCFKALVASHLSMIVFPGTTERMNIISVGGKRPIK